MKTVTCAAFPCLAACTRQSPEETLRNERLGALNRIADHCHLPRSSFRLRGANELAMIAPENVDYRDMDCAIAELRKTGLINLMPVGIVGSQIEVEEDRHASSH